MKLKNAVPVTLEYKITQLNENSGCCEIVEKRVRKRELQRGSSPVTPVKKKSPVLSEARSAIDRFSNRETVSNSPILPPFAYVHR